MIDRLTIDGDEPQQLRDELQHEVDNIATQIENRYGLMDKAYTLFINFYPGKEPVTETNEINKQVVIHLPLYTLAKSEKWQRKLNLSHEMIHAITPCQDTSKTSYLDEGLATLFSEQYAGGTSNPPPKYAEAKKLVDDLLSVDAEIIKKLRAKHPTKKLSDYSADEILQQLPAEKIPEAKEIVLKIIRKFN